MYSHTTKFHSKFLIYDNTHSKRTHCALICLKNLILYFERFINEDFQRFINKDCHDLLKNIITSSIFELEKCYLHKNGVEFCQKLNGNQFRGVGRQFYL